MSLGDQYPNQDYPPHEYVEVRNSMGLLDPDSLEERLRRAEHHAGLLEIGLPYRQSHCWLCRRAHDRLGEHSSNPREDR